jgi:signal transduction histidine kinase
MNENENMLRSGERVWIAWTNKAIVDKEGNVTEILCIGADITRSKLAEQRLLNYQKQLQSLASELSLAEERERRRIAVDLHDRIAQSMGLARIKIEELSKSGHCADAGQSIAEIRNLLDQTIQATRSLTFELCPPVLYELGFETALEWQMEEIRKLYGLTINFENSMNAAPLDDDMRVILFQATRELLVNVAKHAGAKSARVCVEKNGRCIRINVEDDGVGFDMAEAERRVGKNGGFGLFSIRERLKYLGGRLECDSQQGCGTRISLVAPMKKG